ncbi:MAG: bifunctional 3'-5' exonuclease/DNA polymerase, partial [Sciscionella sp.]
MYAVAIATQDGGGVVAELDEHGVQRGPPGTVPDLAAHLTATTPAQRWVWPRTRETYPALLRRGVRVPRCHDLELTESILLQHAERHDQPRSFAAAVARALGLPAPPDRAAASAGRELTLFGPESPALPGDLSTVQAACLVLRAQLATLREQPALRLLVAAESAGALAAAEMHHFGLPWSERAHRELLLAQFGPRQPPGVRPAALATLAARITEAFHGREVNPDSPASVLRAFSREGFSLSSTRA